MLNGTSSDPLTTAIVVAIPTFRRLDLLSQLLDGLIPQAQAVGATIIVGDNACEASVEQHIASLAASVDIHYLPVPARGVSQARNALINEALRLAPGWDWLLMLDDDGLVTPGWIETITACGAHWQADLVGGPVIGVLPQGASRLARNSLFATRKRWPTGLVPMLNTTQNLGIRRKLLDLLPLPLFANRLGASGGEDYDLFRRAFHAGGKLVWCDEAEVLEPAPPERLTVRGLFHRYYSTGVYLAPIDVSYDGWGKEAVMAAKGFVASIIRVVGAGILGKKDAASKAALMTAHYAGRMAGLVGARSARYVTDERKSQ